jgi:hypothetical protein
VQETLGGIGIDRPRGKGWRGRRIGIGARASFGNFSIGAGFSFGVEENVPGGPFASRSINPGRCMMFQGVTFKGDVLLLPPSRICL